MRRGWNYVLEVVRTHPFNFCTLVVTLCATVFAGWSVWEAHQTRVDAATAAKAQSADVARSRKAAEKSAHAAAILADATQNMATAAKDSAESSKRTSRIAQRSYDDMRAIHALDLDPQIEVRLAAEKKLVTIDNVGAADAVKALIRFIILSVPPTLPEVRGTVYGYERSSDCEFSLPVFAAHSTQQFTLPSDCTPSWNALLDQVLLIDFSYLRNPDRRFYRGHIVYFVNRDGLKSPAEIGESEKKRQILGWVRQVMQNFIRHESPVPLRPGGFGQKIEQDWAGYKK